MRVALGVAIALFATTTADARPITFGASLGLSHSAEDADAGFDARQTLGLFGRLGFTSRLAGQLEMYRVANDGNGVRIRTGTVALVVDLVDGKQVVPTIVAGVGLDSADDGFETRRGHHIEGGLGLEYRSPSGFTIGADVRLGGRSVDEEEEVVFADDDKVVFLAGPDRLTEGGYRTARVWLGVRF